MTILIFLIVGYILLSYGLTLLFPKADVDGSKGWIPGLNFGIWAELVGRKKNYAWWMLFPIVNIFIYAGLAVDLVRSFGKYSFLDSFLAVIAGPLYFIYLGRKEDTQYVGKTLDLEAAYNEKLQAAKEAGKTREYERLKNRNPYKKTVLRENFESLVFAVFAAAFIRMFLIEAYTIPTSSMEDSLMVGDYLFVSKVHYGMRTPMTVLQVPLLHNRVPFLNTESYLENPSLPYFRFPALESLDRNEPVVFNWPVGDSVFVLPSRTVDIGQARRSGQLQQYQRQYEFITRPLDKTDFYVKRCIAVAGDTLEIRDRQVYINGEAAKNPAGLQYIYVVRFNGPPVNTAKFTEWLISKEDVRQFTNEGMVVVLTNKQKERLQSMLPNATFEVADLSKNPVPADHFFPHDPENFGGWDYDNFGPLYIPKKGATVELSPENIAPYERIISVYEDNQLEIKGDDIYINGERTNSYTFQQDYFWMMGDNRHNSEDSRIWGYVPETHIVGKPLFIFFSTVEGSLGNGIRWDRIFKSAVSSVD